jgi:arylsulfatase A-like enzyme
MTGLYANKLGIQDGALFPGEARYGVPTTFTTLPQVLQAGGYDTYMVGKWHLGLVEEAQLPLQRGFEKFFGILQGAEGYFNRRIGIRCDSANPVFNDGLPQMYGSNCFFINGVDIMEGNSPSRAYNPAVGGSSQYATDIFATKAVEYINDHNASNPMFFYFAPTAPHSPLDTSAAYTSRCGNVQPTAASLRTDFRQRICSMVASIDNAVSQIISALSAKGMLDSTLIIYTSDNGGVLSFGSVNGNFNGGKAQTLDGGVRAVSFISGTPIQSAANTYGHERTDPVQATDIFATICQYAGVETPDGLDSKPFYQNLIHGHKFTRNMVNMDFTGSALSYSGAVKFLHRGTWYKYLNNPSQLALFVGYISSAPGGEFLFNMDTNPTEDYSQNLIPSNLDPTQDLVSQFASTKDAQAYIKGKGYMNDIITNGAADEFNPPMTFPYHPSPSGCWIPSNSPYWTTVSCGVSWRPVPGN